MLAFDERKRSGPARRNRDNDESVTNHETAPARAILHEHADALRVVAASRIDLELRAIGREHKVRFFTRLQAYTCGLHALISRLASTVRKACPTARGDLRAGRGLEAFGRLDPSRGIRLGERLNARLERIEDVTNDRTWPAGSVDVARETAVGAPHPNGYKKGSTVANGP